MSESVELQEGLSVGAIWCVNQVATELGLFEDKQCEIKEDGMLKLELDEEALNEERCLDGCYVIKTDLKEEAADK